MLKKSSCEKTTTTTTHNPQHLQPTTHNPQHLPFSLKTDIMDWLEVSLVLSTDVHARDDKGNTVLHLAVQFPGEKDAVAMVDIMLQNGVRFSTTNHAGETPLHIAAALGRVAVARDLMAAGADATIADFGGDDVVDIFGGRCSEFLALEGRSSFDRAVEGGHVDVVVMMIEKGVDPTARSSRALLFASTGNMVDTLVEAGCNVQDSNGTEALMKACRNGNMGVLRALSMHGVNEDRRRTRIEIECFLSEVKWGNFK